MKRVLIFGLSAFLFASTVSEVRAEEDPGIARTEDVIYARKFGTALTMDVFAPKKEGNRAAVILVVSGGWFSAHESINIGFCAEFVKRGYTVFAVVHGSQPRFTIPEAIGDMHRATRFIRHNAAKYNIDPERIGITGGSAGGHLSLMQGLAGTPGNPKAKDPVEQASSRVQAVACFFPPTDFLNWGEEGKNVNDTDIGKRLKAPFEFQEIDPKTNSFTAITDEKKYLAILKLVSPINHVSSDDPPILMIHGDKDKIVPVQQAELLTAKLKEAKVPVELVVKTGADHGWTDMAKDLTTLADWFDKHLLKK